MPGERVRLIGGQVITGFTTVKDAAVQKRLDLTARRHVRQVDLKARGLGRLTRMRSRGFGRS
ncbi:MAG TPA: hypothetical protein QF604_01530, partial [Candidatus Latescibacteria bacterium]|nr:hypothetical protein [Candidatus Latescibacterota bacterium]